MRYSGGLSLLTLTDTIFPTPKGQFTLQVSYPKSSAEADDLEAATRRSSTSWLTRARIARPLDARR